MKTRIFLLTLILVFFGISSTFAQQNPSCTALSFLKSNQIAQVVAGKTILIHAQPDENSPVLGEYKAETVFSLESGPNCKGNLPWWPIEYKEVRAWISETDGKSYNIVPYVMPTPSGVFPAETTSLDPKIISIDNASRLVEQDHFGSGWPTDADWSVDGKTMAVATSIGIRLYDVTKPDDNSTPFELMKDNVYINDVAFSPDGHLLAAAGKNGILYVRNTQSRQLAYSHKLSNELKLLSFSPDGKWLAFTEFFKSIDPNGGFINRVWLFEAQTGIQQSFVDKNEKDSFLKRIAFSDDSQRLVLYYESVIEVYHVDSANKLISEPLTGLDNVSAWALSADGQQRAVLQSSGDDDALVQHLSIQDAQSHEELINKDVSKEPDVKRLLFNPKGDLLFSVDWRGRLSARSPKTLQIKGLITENPDLIIFSPDKSLMATASLSGGIRIFTTPVTDANGTMHFRQLKVFSGIVGAASHIIFSPDQTRLAAIGSDRTIRIWDLSSGKALVVYRDFIVPMDPLAVSPNGALLATRGEPNNLYLWDTQTGEHLETFKSFGYRPIFSPDNTYLMALGLSIETWNIKKGTHSSFKRTNGTMGGNLTFLSNNRLLGTGFPDPHRVQSITISDSGDLKFSTNTGIPDTSTITRLKMSADGTILVLGDTNTVTIYDAASYKPLQQFADFGTDILLSHNGRILSVIQSVKWGAQDLTITLWDTLTGTLIAETDKPLRAQPIMPLIIYPSNYKTDMKLSYDGRLLAAAYIDGSIRLWDLLTNREVAVLKGHTSAVSAIEFSPDGTKLYSVGNDGTIRQWGLSN